MKIIDLNGAWTVRGDKYAPDGLPARVPGCIHEDLLREGLLEDPFYRDNEKKAQWVGREDWTFSRRFTVDDAILDEARVELVCEGIDTIATVFINEAVVGKTGNMHRAYRFDIKPHLRPGENTVTIAIESPLNYVAKRQAVRQMPEWADPDKQNGHGQIRKMACNFGWDWAPMLATSGIWQPIRIEARSTPRIAHVRITQTHQENHVELQVCPELSEACKGAVAIRVDGPGGVSVASIESDPQTPATVRIDHPELWWPRGLGRQPLYTVTVELRDAREDVVDSMTKRIGLRRLELVREPDEWGESFFFKANGQPFFGKGTNMIPTSPYGTCRDPARYRVILERAANEHLNMIRIWGGGIYEIDAFYDLCDEMGFVVWQDFMFACSGYPLDEPEFLANVCEEARQQVRRLGHHACIGLWNGNNELEFGWSDGWGLVGETFVPGSFGKMEVGVYSKFFDDTLRRIGAAEAPQTAYWPASPHSPAGDRRDSNSERCGDAHIWHVLTRGEPFEFHHKCRNRFVSEYGFQSLPDAQTWETCLAEGDDNLTSPMVDFHQRCHFLGNAALTLNFARYFRMPKDFAMTCILSQILHGLLIKGAVEEWRRNMPRTMGAINWMLNDVWPGVTHSTNDYLDKPKAAHYLHRQCMNPVLVSGRTDSTRGTAEIHLTCDGHPHQRGTLSWHLIHVDGRVLANGGQEVALPQHQTQLVRTLDFKAQLEEFEPGHLLLFLEITDEMGALIGDNVLVWCPWKHLNLHPAAIMARQDGNHIELSTDKPALWVWLDQPAGGPVLQDNFVHLRPGLTRKTNLLEPGTFRALDPKSLHDTHGQSIRDR